MNVSTAHRSQIDRPIFILGSGRCGSTALHQAFTLHPRIAFLSGLCKLHPDKPWLNRYAMRSMSVPLLQMYFRKKFRPAEHWEFWDYYLRGFSAPCRDLVADDVRPHHRERIRSVLSEMLTPQRNRMLIKLTGWPRVSYLSEIFPDALFIHLIRDGRAVVNSMLDVDFWQGWRGIPFLTWGEMTPALIREWERNDKSFVAMAAIQWRSLMDLFENVESEMPSSRFLRVRYEDLTADPLNVFGQILEFCQLDYPSEFKTSIQRFGIQSMNYKWDSHFTNHQKQIIEECLKDHLPRYGYPLAHLEPQVSKAGEVSNLTS